MRVLLGIRRTTKISIFLGVFLIGLCLARIIDSGSYVVLSGVSLVCVLIRKSPIIHIVGIVVLGLTLGLWRGNVFMKRLQVYQDYSRQKVTIRATAVSDSVYADKGQLSFDVGSAQIVEPINQKIEGKVGIKGYGESMIYRGDTVLVSAKLYPTRGSKQASMGYAEIERIHSGTSIVDTYRRKFAAGLQSVVPEPLGSFGLGILIGQRTTLPKILNDQMSAVGLTHIVAVSGYNLTIIILAVHRLMKKRSKYQSTIAAVVLISLFLALTGTSASIVRAAIVSLLSLWAWYYGRKFRPILLLLLAAVMTAGWFPPYIWSDIGWYLSFLAFTGVLLLAPLLSQRISKKKEPKVVAQVLIETLSAQLLTLPLIMYIFGRLSLVAIVSNMLVVPLVPLAMACSFVAGLGGMFFPSIAGWVAWPATLAMTYMIDIVGLLSKLPYASIGQQINLAQLVVLYGIIVVIILILWRKTGADVKIKKLKPKLSQVNVMRS